MTDADVFLTVPFTDKDSAKALGARWNQDRKQWFVPAGTDPAPFAQWAEIRMDESKWTRVPASNPRLYIDLVPQSCWFSNLRSELSANEWDVLRKTTYALAGNLCEVCGGRGPAHPIEAHERWEYDDATSTQKLIGISALCPSCHESTHMGLAAVRGRDREAIAHLKAVNTFTDTQAHEHVDAAFAEWEVRSQKAWKLDVTFLKTCGISLSLPTAAKLLNFETHDREPRYKPADKRMPASRNSIKDFGEDGGDISVADAMNHFFKE